jgi:acetylornithine deacetylase/succinyl-diaminopimelate desuccinylase-like protein
MNPRWVSELMDFIRFPSVSAQARHAGDVARCGAWLAEHLRGIGFGNARLIPTAKHPIVHASRRGAGHRPTVLIYGHYDVQPAEPLGEWRSPPFEPTIRDGFLHGRGASDDKGQLFCQLKALEWCWRETGSLPVNVECLLEGEEEIGSPSLLRFLSQHREEFRADVAVVSDTAMLGPDRPALTFSLRGALSLEVIVRGPGHDLHSGSFGGAIHNPLQGLCEMLAGLHGPDGRIAIPGFYESVREWPRDQRAELARSGPSDADVLRAAQAERGWGEEGYSLDERRTIRPALTINGLSGGYAGDGPKAIIPSLAMAKLNFRLVPDQDPFEVDRLFRRHLQRITPPALRTEVRTEMTARPALLDRRHPAMRAASVAYQRGFGHWPVFVREGGSIPVVNAFQEVLGIPTVLMGFGLPDDRIHSPNERMELATFFKGVRTARSFLDELGRMAPAWPAAGRSSRGTRRAIQETRRPAARETLVGPVTATGGANYS